MIFYFTVGNITWISLSKLGKCSFLHLKSKITIDFLFVHVGIIKVEVMLIGILNIENLNNQIQESIFTKDVYNGAFESMIEIWKLVSTCHNFSHL
jgi:hypothetical protein